MNPFDAFLMDCVRDSLSGYTREREPLRPEDRAGQDSIGAATACPDCDGEGYWKIYEPGRGLQDATAGRLVKYEACPYCGGTGRKP